MGYLFSLSKSATTEWLAASEWTLLISGIVLAAGIVGEVKSGRFSMWRHKFELMVLWSVLGELLADGGIFLFSSRLQSIVDSENIALHTTAEEAKERAGKAIERAAALEKETVDLRIKLADSSIPRSLEDDAQKRVATKLPQRSTGGQVNVMYLPWTFDGLSLARQILGALGKAGVFNGPQIDVTSTEDGIPRGFASMPARVFTGIQVMHTSDLRSIKYASALSNALTAEHLEEVSMIPA